MQCADQRRLIFFFVLHSYIVFLSIMNKIIVGVLAIVFVASCGNKTVYKGASLKIDHVEEYCGGAAPPDALLQQLETPKPLNDTLYIHPDSDPTRDQEGVIVVLNDGKADLSGLPKGCYIVFRNPALSMDSVIGNPEIHHCRVEESRVPIFGFNLYADGQVISDTILTTCDPCLPPMP